MIRRIGWLSALPVLMWTTGLMAADPKGLIDRKTPTGTIVGYKDTPLLPWTGNKYHMHDPDRPIPRVVTLGPHYSPKTGNSAPSDAVVLFDGKDLAHWKPSSWKIVDGTMQAGHESLETKAVFGDCQLHVEWMTPAKPTPEFMNRGNSGVILMGQYEIQIFDSWPGHKKQIYPDGQAASVYGQTPPLVNVCRRPGQWQSYDIFFRAPVFQNDRLVQRASVTMLHNDVLVQWNQPIMGPMSHRVVLPYRAHAAKLPLVLQGHGCPVRFRNVWIRSLD